MRMSRADPQMHPVHTAVIRDYGLSAYDGVPTSDVLCHACLMADSLINGSNYGSKIRISPQENADWHEFPKRVPLCHDDGLVSERFEQQPIAIHNS